MNAKSGTLRLETLFVAALVLAGGCATPSARISESLQRYGLDQQRSECVGESLADHLSIDQLKSLGRAADAYKRDDTTPGALTASDLVRVAGEIDDLEVPLQVGRAVATCGVLFHQK